jgi:hypothetical protein
LQHQVDILEQCVLLCLLLETHYCHLM